MSEPLVCADCGKAVVIIPSRVDHVGRWGFGERPHTAHLVASDRDDGLRDLLRRLDGWASDSDRRYESADEMVGVARRDLRAALAVPSDAPEKP